MSQPAYTQDGLPIDAEAFYACACDPTRSVVVEACAGAGKTWMLVSRILRALLEGQAPSAILAITFTRKAAGEMRERLAQWLMQFAQQSPQERLQELQMRGLSHEASLALVEPLGRLYEDWLTSGEQPRISTIHSWFAGLLKGLPLDVQTRLGLPGTWQLLEDTDTHWPQIWSAFVRALHAHQHTPAHGLFMQAVVQGSGLYNLQEWLRAALSQRMEVTLAQQAGTLLDSVPPADVVFPELVGLDDPAQWLWQAQVKQPFVTMAKALGALPGKTAQALAADVVEAYEAATPELCYQTLYAALITDKGEPRKLRGVSHPWLSQAQDVLLRLSQARWQQQAHLQHQAMVWASHVLFETYAQYKQMHGLVDMQDLELAAAHLHADASLSGWVQERLDIRIRHLLVDEFQDTSPLQWHTLSQWISAYAGAGGGLSGQHPLTVFLVGDPKQSIYGFRRADPRVFASATELVRRVLHGVVLGCDHTRRNAQAVVHAVNEVMHHLASQGGYAHFRRHTTASPSEGQVGVLPDVVVDDVQAVQETQAPAALWRDTLNEPRETAQEAAVMPEARQCARAIAGLLAQALPPDAAWRPEQVFVLARKRSDLAAVGQALDEYGIPNVCPENRRLMDTAEARDLLAVMEAVIFPWHDLALAHALRTPAFRASDGLLMALAQHARSAGVSWWDALQHLMPAETADLECLVRARRLFARWKQVADRWPPHDLLQMIVDDSDWRVALARLLPPAPLQQALTCLDAVVAESLRLHGGRDATPWRWLEALREQHTALPSAAQAGAVQLLTIHGAKGLEARAVFVIQTDPRPPVAAGYTLMVDWPAELAAPAACAFVARQSQLAPSLQTLKAQHAQMQYLEECNALYVAMTRACDVLVFSRSVGRSSRSSDTSWWHHLWASGALTEACTWHVPIDAAPIDAGGLLSATGIHTLRLNPIVLPLADVSANDRLSLGKGTPSAVDADKNLRHTDPDELDTSASQGVVVHKVLEWVGNGSITQQINKPAVQALVERACAQLQPHGRAMVVDPESLASQIWAMLQHEDAVHWCASPKTLWAGNEVELWSQGQLLRLDRLLAQPDANGQRHWWVIDFKWHEAPASVPAYVQQLRSYLQAVRTLHSQDKASAAFVNRHGQWLPLST